MDGFEETFPYAIRDPRNNHCVVWYSRLDAKHQDTGIIQATELWERYQKYFLNYEEFPDTRYSGYIKSGVGVLHNVLEDKSIDGPWIPDYGKDNVSYLYDNTDCNNTVLKEWGLI